jgi:hypothetical protein
VRGFGDDSRLRNVWEELCVQLQSEEGFGFAAYEETVRAIIEGCVQELPRYVVTALWLRTRAADDWRDRDGYTRFDQDRHLPICDDDVVQYVLAEYVYPLGNDWSNARIRDFLDPTGPLD